MNVKSDIRLIEKNKFATCMPLISANKNELFVDVEAGVKCGYDFLEWRRDHFMKGKMISREEEIDILKEIKKRMKTQGLIYTYRSHLEGGVYETSDDVREAAVKAAIESNVVDYVDVELESNEMFLEEIRTALKNSRTQWILSHHNYDTIPTNEKIEKIYKSMEAQGADALKLAVTPHSIDDIRHLIMATLLYNDCSQLPVIAIAMGHLGAITRIATELCGGSLTYVAGNEKTAPGQLNMEEIIELRKRMALI